MGLNSIVGHAYRVYRDMEGGVNMSHPHCYGEMIWILKYPEDDVPRESICSCNYTNTCLRLTRENAVNKKRLSGTAIPKEPISKKI